MKSISPRPTNGMTAIVVAASITVALAGCASPTLMTVKTGSRSEAKQLGFPNCRVSVPLSQSEVIEDAKLIGNPHPEDDPEWIAITKNIQSGDHLRAVDCLNEERSRVGGGTYFYTLIRNNKILLKFDLGMFN